MPASPAVNTKERKPKPATSTSSTHTEGREDSRQRNREKNNSGSTGRSSKRASKHSSPVTAGTMSSATSSSSSSSAASSAAHETTYYYVPNLQALDPSAREVDASSHTWVQPTIIEDDDLTFGGKSLSAWYEEDRRRFSHSDGEEERRGRERVRRSYPDKGGSRK